MNSKNVIIFGALLTLFTLMNFATCSKASAEEINLDTLDARFYNSELDYEMTQLTEELEEGEEVFTPDNREPSHTVSTPEVFKDSDIKRKLKDGTTQAFDGDKYMIVRRKHKHDKPKKPIKCQAQIIEKEVVVKEHSKRAISVMLGHGPTDRLDISRYANGAASIRNSNGVVGTLQYQQRFHKDGYFWSGQFQTNETYSVGFGKSF